MPLLEMVVSQELFADPVLSQAFTDNGESPSSSAMKRDMVRELWEVQGREDSPLSSLLEGGAEKQQLTLLL